MFVQVQINKKFCILLLIKHTHNPVSVALGTGKGNNGYAYLKGKRNVEDGFKHLFNTSSYS